MVYRIYVEKKPGFDVAAQKVRADLAAVLGVRAEQVRQLLRYDVENIEPADFEAARTVVFSEPPADQIFEELPFGPEHLLAVEYLPGQYDQRADSAAQCVQLLTFKPRPLVRCATLYKLEGVTDAEFERVKNYLINPVESREASLEKPETLADTAGEGADVPVIEGFCQMSDQEIAIWHAAQGFAMSVEDLCFVRDYFKGLGRDPFETELKVIDTYWSDHCRHTTFLTELEKVEINSPNARIAETYRTYQKLFSELYAGRKDKYVCLMDLATIGAKALKKRGLLKDLDESGEINACSIKVKADVDGEEKDYLVMFKNETHNHPTEIEPFGGAATCLGGAIRDPLSGRTYVYQSMRVTGAADPTGEVSDTLPGKLPQRVITKTATAGFSSYGNQIGLATGQVHEVYHPNFAAKRLETGFVVAAAPAENVIREEPEPGDAVILLGGDTGRDGCGGATGSSKAHNAHSVAECGAEVQKGNPLTERKIQRLFRKKEVTTLIRRCNDFGAGGVCVAIGELADGLDIDLDKVPKKYKGLTGTELAISESQERMAVVVRAADAQKFMDCCAEENLNAVAVATVTDTGRMRMTFKGRTIVDLERAFLNTNGVKQRAEARIADPVSAYAEKIFPETAKVWEEKGLKAALLYELGRLNVGSQKGMGEHFDSTIGAGTVFMPFGGRRQLTPSQVMAAKIPMSGHTTSTATVAAFGYDPYLMEESCFTGAVYSVLLSVAKLTAAGVDPEGIYLTFQEYFKRLHRDPERWGCPASALLGALYAQLELDLGAIGGKDSMSGSFEDLDVPSTLISFALGVQSTDKLITNVLKKPRKVWRLCLKKDEYGVPDLGYAKKLFKALHAEIEGGRVDFAAVCEEGGPFAAAVKSCLGEGLGFAFALPAEELLKPAFGDLLIAGDPEGLREFCPVFLGESLKKEVFTLENVTLTGKEALENFRAKLEPVYPTASRQVEGKAPAADFTGPAPVYGGPKFARPRVFIPVFPGTNCEFDTAERFRRAGAEVCEFLVRNRSAAEIDASAEAMARLLDTCQIAAFPGGFSGGDEPDGSGKFIATTFRSPRLRDSLQKLLEERDGLMLGICNGFQALIKLGLVPYGKVCELGPDSPTLTFNHIGRHVSTLCRIRVASQKSPWFSGVKTGEIFTVPVSHGEGRFVCPPDLLDKLVKNGQIATQYVDEKGEPTLTSPFNPNGSVLGVEGILSPDGRILGKMGHAERIGGGLYQNVEGNFDMKIFESGVAYFR